MITKSIPGGIVVLYPVGFLTGGEETKEFELELKVALDESSTKAIVVNCRKVEHLNATALGVLISAHSRAVRNGRLLWLCCVDKKIENIFVITKLALVFDVYPTEEQAIAAITVHLEAQKR